MFQHFRVFYWIDIDFEKKFGEFYEKTGDEP